MTNPVRCLLLAATATAALLGVTPVHAQSGDEVGARQVVVPLHPDGQDTVVPAELDGALRRFAALWQDGDARAISGLVQSGRVHVVVPREGVGARLSSGQLQFFLEELFEESRAVRLRFPDTVGYDPSTRTGWAVGERVYREGQALDARADQLFVGLRNDRGRWSLTEIRLTATR